MTKATTPKSGGGMVAEGLGERVVARSAGGNQALKVVKVSPRTVQAARLRKTINDRLGKPTSPVTIKIASVGQ